jgi:hypothetical protein
MAPFWFTLFFLVNVVVSVLQTGVIAFAHVQGNRSSSQRFSAQVEMILLDGFLSLRTADDRPA